MAALDDFMARLAALGSTESTVAKLRRKIQAAAVEYQTAVAPDPEPPPPPPPPARLVRCVNDHPIWYRGDWAAYRALYVDGRVQAVRADIPWSVINDGGRPPAGYEATSTVPAQFNALRVGIIDTWATMMRDLGIKVTFVVGGAPSWASNGSGNGLGAGHEADYAAFCAWVVRRWRPEAVECWNEPAGYWAWAPSGVNVEPAGFYAGMLAAAHLAVKAADPACLVLSGSLFSGGQDPRDQTYLSRLYAAGGAAHFDVLACHAYARHCDPVATLQTWQPPLYDGTRGSLLGVWEKTVRPMMAANGDGTKPVWFNEAGVQCGASGDATYDEQAAAVGAWFGQVAAGTIPEQVRRVYYYTLCGPEGTGDNGWGLVRNDGAPSTMPTAAQLVRLPAFAAFSAA